MPRSTPFSMSLREYVCGPIWYDASAYSLRANNCALVNMHAIVKRCVVLQALAFDFLAEPKCEVIAI